ncbi:MAG TPA: thiamine-phosphate synthase family protein [Candidatus Thermoplasmatota archaeon]|nr:thiamine-phosphate synthase family protein [Candidatus Thermoplasmatota archaeon]
MRFPEEIVASHFVPTVRALLARALEARGMNQTEIAQHLGVSQTAVSKYLLARVAIEPTFAGDPRLKDAVERVAAGFAESRLAPIEALAVFADVVRAFENRGPICALHEEAMPALKGLGCDLCVRPPGGHLLEEQSVLADVREAVRTLEAAPGFAAAIPHVGSNVAMTLARARDAADVAAVPGGLFEMRGRVRSAAPPEFGASKHVSEILLAIRRADPARRACVNLATTDAFLEAARGAGLTTREIPATVDRAPARLADLLGGRPVPDVLYHRGDFGIEPITYMVGPSASGLAHTLARLLA